MPNFNHLPRNKGPRWKEIFVGETCKKHAFWFIIGFLATLTIKDVAELIMEYSEDPKLTDFTIVFNESITMPNITFCMSKDQGMSHFDILLDNITDIAEWDTIVQEQLTNMSDRETFLKNPWNFRLVMNAYDVISHLFSIERELTPHNTIRNIDMLKNHPRLEEKREGLKIFLAAIKERNVTFQEFTQKTGIEVLRRSIQRFSRFVYDEDIVVKTTPRITWISTQHLCFQPEYDQNNFLPITDQGKFFVLMLTHEPTLMERKSVDCMSIDVHGRPSGLARYMQGRAQVKNGFRDDLCLGQGHEVTIEVRAKYKMIENEEEGTNCHEFEENEDSQFDCFSRCRMEMIRSVCQCTALSLSYLVNDESEFETYPLCDYMKCEIDIQRKNHSDKECVKNCRRDCSQTRYNVEVETRGRMVRQELTLIELYWGSFEYLNLEQERKYNIVTFAAAIGGSIGVWLGLSVLSLMQGLTYCLQMGKRKIQKISVHSSGLEGKIKPIKKVSSKLSVTEEKSTPYDSRLSINPLPSEIATNPFASPFRVSEKRNIRKGSRKRTHLTVEKSEEKSKPRIRKLLAKGRSFDDLGEKNKGIIKTASFDSIKSFQE